MAEKVLARRTLVSVTFAGTDITEDIKPYLLSMRYTDDMDDMTDDIQLNLQDRDGIWLESWLTEAVTAAASGKLKISAVITSENWGDNGALPTGAFELDSVEAAGPPSTIAINGTSLAFSAAVRQTKKSKAWENYTLSGIAKEIAGNGGMGCMFESSSNPTYDRVEQVDQSDIDFLRKLCDDAGVSVKATDGKLVLFDFPGMGLQDTSGWLPVLINQDVMHYYPYDEPQWTEFETECKEPRTGDKDFAEHRHKVIIKPYLPKVGDQVLCIYYPVFSADGFILGGIQPWQ